MLLSACLDTGSTIHPPAQTSTLPTPLPGDASMTATVPLSRPVATPAIAPTTGPTLTTTPPLPTATLLSTDPVQTRSGQQGFWLLQFQEFHPDHNAFLREDIVQFCKAQG
jgi:hypothetical protein